MVALVDHQPGLEVEPVAPAGQAPAHFGVFVTGQQRVEAADAQEGGTAYQEVGAGDRGDAEAVRRLTIDPHSPPDLRCNAVVTNLDAFHEAFDVTESDATRPGRSDPTTVRMSVVMPPA